MENLIFSQQQLVIFLLVATVIVAGVLIIVWQQVRIHRLHQAARPKYGFLGKPIYSFFLLALVAGGFWATYYAIQHPQGITVKADKNIELSIQTQVVSSTTETAKVKFILLPTVDGELWGGAGGGLFDVF
jgi:hypothetical protein